MLLANYVVPITGIGVRAAYLKKFHALDLDQIAAGLTGTALIELAVFAFGGLAGLALVRQTGAATASSLAAVFLVVGILASGLCLLAPRVTGMPNSRIMAAVARGLESWRRIARDWRIIASVAAVTVIQFVSFATLFWIAFGVVAPNIDTGSVLIAAAVTDFAFFVRIAPAALGSFEAAVAYAGNIQNIGLADSLIVSALLRGTTLLWLLAVGPVVLSRFFRRNRTA